MSGSTTASKPTGTTKASTRYDDQNTDSIHRTQSQIDAQSLDRNNPMDTESEAGASEASTLQGQFEMR